MCPGRCKIQPMNGLGRTKSSQNSDGCAPLVVHMHKGCCQYWDFELVCIIQLVSCPCFPFWLGVQCLCWNFCNKSVLFQAQIPLCWWRVSKPTSEVGVFKKIRQSWADFQFFLSLKAPNLRSRFWKPNFPTPVTSRAVYCLWSIAMRVSWVLDFAGVFGLKAHQLGSYMWLRGGVLCSQVPKWVGEAD